MLYSLHFVFTMCSRQRHIDICTYVPYYGGTYIILNHFGILWVQCCKYYALYFVSCTYVHTYIWMCICTYLRMSVHMYCEYIYIHMLVKPTCVCMYVRTCVCILGYFDCDFMLPNYLLLLSATQFICRVIAYFVKAVLFLHCLCRRVCRPAYVDWVH
jgi:hypothetical protein